MSSKWNQSLRDALSEAFLGAVRQFNAGCGLMKYSWPCFLPSAGTSPFFHAKMQDLLEGLKDDPVLESYAGGLVQPRELIYVDQTRYADDTGHPFTLSEQTATRYLSTRYPTWNLESLRLLGVRIMSGEEFLEDLKTMISNDCEAFRRRSPQWHARLAKSLLTLTIVFSLLSEMMTLSIIPLSSDQWACEDQKPFFFQ